MGMPRFSRILLFAAVAALAWGVRASADPLNPVFADASTASLILARDDEYLSSLSAFDKAAILHRKGPAALAEIKALLAAQGLDWTAAEKAKVSSILADIGGLLSPYAVDFPATVYFVLTTGRDFGEAGDNNYYTRGNDSVVLSRKTVGEDEAALREDILRELFHLFFRHHPEAADRLIGIIGFRKVGELDVPAALDERLITNPDMVHPVYAFRTRLQGRQVDFIPLLVASTPYIRGSILRDFSVKCIGVEEGSLSTTVIPDGYFPLALDPDVVPGFHERTGGNSFRLLQPLEILADNFVIMVTGSGRVMTPRIVEQLRDALRKEGGAQR